MNVFELFAKIGLDDSEYKSKLESSKSGFQKFGETIQKGIGTAVKVTSAAVAAGASATAVLVKNAVDAYAEYEQLEGGTKLLFGDASDFIMNKSKEAYSTVQMSQNEYLQQVNGFAVGLKTSLGGNAQAAAELADRIVNAEADVVAATGNTQEAVQNAFNGIMKSNFTMLDNLQIGITPTKEGFQEVIDKVNKWRADQGEATNYVIDNLADCQSALVDYIEMQGLSGYAANEAADTISGSLSMMKGAWSNLLVGVADDTADFDSLVNNFVDSVGQVAKNVLPRMQVVVGAIPTLIDKIAPMIPGLIESLLPSLITGGISLIKGVVASLPTIFGALIDAIPQIASMLKEQFSSSFDLGDGLFSGVIDGFKEFYDFAQTYVKFTLSELKENFEALKNALDPFISKLKESVTSGKAGKDAMETLKSAFATTVDVVAKVAGGIAILITKLIEHKSLVEGIVIVIGSFVASFKLVTTAIAAWTAATSLAAAAGGALTTAIAGISAPIVVAVAAIGGLIAAGVLLVKNWDAIKAGASSAFNSAKEYVSQFISSAIDGFNRFKSSAVTLFQSAMTSIINILNSIISSVSAWANNVVNTIRTAFGNVSSIGTNLVQGIWNGISNGYSWITNKIAGWVGNVMAFFKKKFGIASPSKLMRDEVGRFLAEGVWVGWEENDPMKMIEKSLNMSVGNLESNIQLKTPSKAGAMEEQSLINYNKLASIMTKAFEETNLVVNVDRNFNRAVRSAINYA